MAKKSKGELVVLKELVQPILVDGDDALGRIHNKHSSIKDDKEFEKAVKKERKAFLSATKKAHKKTIDAGVSVYVIVYDKWLQRYL